MALVLHTNFTTFPNLYKNRQAMFSSVNLNHVKNLPGLQGQITDCPLQQGAETGVMLTLKNLIITSSQKKENLRRTSLVSHLINMHTDLARPRVYSDLEAIFLVILRGTEDRRVSACHRG